MPRLDYQELCCLWTGLSIEVFFSKDTFFASWAGTRIPCVFTVVREILTLLGAWGHFSQSGAEVASVVSSV